MLLIKASLQIGGIISLCIFILAIILDLRNANLFIPFVYSGDAIFTSVIIKSIIETGWYLENPHIGLPTGAYWYDFPLVEAWHFLIIKVISWWIPDAVFILNFYYLLTFPLTALTSLSVLRHFNISYSISVVISLLYAFMPYHFFRGEGHLFLSAYYIIPLLIMVTLWITEENKRIFFSLNAPNFNLLNTRSIIAVSVCVLAGGSGVYYAFFSCLFFGVAGLIAGFQQKKMYPFYTAIILILFITTSLILNLLPNILYMYDQGQNIETARRGINESEIYGLKIVQLLLPITGHRVSFFANAVTRYNSTMPLVNENIMVSLGFVGSIGFLYLIGRLFFCIRQNSMLEKLSRLNLVGLLLGTIGGMGTIFAMMVSPQIRAYNRISIFISFFALMAVAIFLQTVYVKYAASSVQKRAGFYCCLLIILTGGVLDQTSRSFIPPYSQLQQIYESDARFIKKIEATIPLGGRIFQLPYVPFPEHPPVHKLTDYSLFRGYLHSKNLHWSYGAMKGRYGDMWQKFVSSRPPEEQVDILVNDGFSGIYLNRLGYQDNAIELIDALSNILGESPLQSDDQQLVFFNLTNYKRTHLSSQISNNVEDISRYPILAAWGNGFFAVENNENMDWRWCGPLGTLMIINTDTVSRNIDINLALQTGNSDPALVFIEGDLLFDRVQVNSTPYRLTRALNITPGTHVIKFRCDAKRFHTSGDLRNLVFRVNDFKMQVLN